MAQLTGTAGRSPSHTSAFVAGTLFAAAAMATVVILALALGVNVTLRDEAAAAEAAGAPTGVGVRTYDGRLDPIEEDYVRSHAYPAHGWGTTPRSRSIDVGPINQDVPVAPSDGLVVATQDGGILYRGIPYEAPATDFQGGSNGTRFAQ